MSEPKPEPRSMPARPGAAVRALREQRGWTLADVSERTGLSVSTLSKVENDKMSLTYDKLSRISKGLAIDIGQLFAAGSAPHGAASSSIRGFSGRRSVSRSGEEFSVVLEGAVLFHTELYAPVLLQAGDSVYFDSSMGHAYLRVGDGPCRVLTVCSDAASLAAAGYPPPVAEPQVQRAPASQEVAVAGTPPPATKSKPPKTAKAAKTRRP